MFSALAHAQENGDDLLAPPEETTPAEALPADDTSTAPPAEGQPDPGGTADAPVPDAQEIDPAARQTRFTHPKAVPAGATAIPGAQEQKDALAQIRKFYAKSYAKRDLPSKARLARRLLEETAKNTADPAILHQLASEAVRLGTEAEAYEPLLEGIELLAGAFSGIDALAEKQAALKKMTGKPVAAAIAKLLTEPADPAANLVAGKWFCVVAHRWPEGIAMLALGSDPELARIAGLEMAAPATGSGQLQLADAWFDIAAKSRAKDEKVGLSTRAMYWYQQALPQLSGLAKDRVGKRMAEIDKLLPLDLDSVDWASLTASQWDKLKGRLATVNARVDRFDPQVTLAAGERVRVVPHPTDQWTIAIDAFLSAGGKKATCDWRGYGGTTYYSTGGSFKPGALLVWIENGEKQNAGIIQGPGRVWFAPCIAEWVTGDRSGTMRVKLIPIPDEE